MIPEDTLAAFLEDALDPTAREGVAVQLSLDPGALDFVLEQRRIDQALRSLLARPSRKQHLRDSIRAAVAGLSRDQLRAQVRAETAGRAPSAGESATARAKPRRVRPPWTESLARILAQWTPVRLAVALGLTLTTLFVCWFLFQTNSGFGPEVGQFAQIIGHPTVRGSSGAAGTQAFPGNPVSMGDRIETGDADRAEIHFRDGTTLRLGFNTAVELPSATGLPGNASNTLQRPPEVHLVKGQVWTKVRKLTNSPTYSIRTHGATALARGTEFGVQVKRIDAATHSAPFATLPAAGGPIATVLTVKEGAVDFFNAFGSVQATAMTESTAREDSAPTEPRRINTLQTVQLASGATWALITSPLDWPDAAGNLVGGGGWLGWHLLDLTGADGTPEVRIGQLASSSPAARSGLRAGDILIALEDRSLTNARGLARDVLLRPGGALNLRVRHRTGEEVVALTVNTATNLLRAPALPAGTLAQLGGLLRRWLDESANASPDPGAESLRFEEAVAFSHLPTIRAVAFNQLGVAWELADALGPAVRAYGRAVNLQPEVPLYRFNLALALRKIGSFERAHEELREAVRLQPESVQARLSLVEVTSLLGHHEEALARATSLLQAAPDDHGALELQAQLLIKLQRPADAVAPARRATELDPGCPVAHGYLAEALHDAGKLEEALAAWTQALDRAPFDAAYLVNLGTLQRELGQLAAAEQTFRQAIALRPDFALAYRNLGESLAARRDDAAAADAMDQAAKLAPQDPIARWRLGDLLIARRQFGAAERAYRDALELSPNDPEALDGLGELFRRQRRSADAERLYRQAIERTPDSSALLNNLGEVLREQGRLDEAEALYREAAELDPGNPAPHGNLGIILAERKQFAEAEKTFRALLGRSTGNDRLQVWVNLAMVCGAQGKLEEAERLLRQALEVAPNHPRVADALADFLADHRLKLDEALTLATRAVQSAPNDPEFLGTLGWVHAQRGDLAAAERTLQRALQLAGREMPTDKIRQHLEWTRERTRPSETNNPSPNP